jgi:hypothetical protein
MTDNELDTLRAGIRELCANHARGDIRERSFQRAFAEHTVDLYRAFVKRFTAEGEAILEEHHVVLGHTRLANSVLREPEQQAISLFATDRRLFRLCSTLLPGSPVTCDDGDKTVVDEVFFDQIQRLQLHRRVRPGEIWAGLVILSFAIIFHSWLSITGTLMIGLGMLGVLHGLLMPTRWIEVRPKYPTAKDPILIYALRRKSGKRLVRLLRERMASPIPS